MWALLDSSPLPPILLLSLLDYDGWERVAQWEKETLLREVCRCGRASLPSNTYEMSSIWYMYLCLYCWILSHRQAQKWFTHCVHLASSKTPVATSPVSSLLLVLLRHPGRSLGWGFCWTLGSVKLLCSSKKDHNTSGHVFCKVGHDGQYRVLGKALPQLSLLLSTKDQVKPETESCLCLISLDVKAVWT